MSKVEHAKAMDSKGASSYAETAKSAEMEEPAEEKEQVQKVQEGEGECGVEGRPE
jgi:hypothetical protein